MTNATQKLIEAVKAVADFLAFQEFDTAIAAAEAEAYEN